MRLYKGFDKDLKCRGFQFQVGKTYETSKAKLCSSGFHACENPVDILNYYPPCTSRYAVVRLEGISDERETDTKRCGTIITIERELTQSEFMAECAAFLATLDLTTQTSGNYSHAQTSGNYGHAQASGNSGHAQASGNYGHAQASGDYGHAQASGNSSVAVSLGMRGKATAADKCRFIVLADWDLTTRELKGIVVGEVGKNIQAGTAYTIKDGELAAC